MSERVTIVGLGNPLMGDDGLGVAAAAKLRDEWVLPPGVEVLDGGTWGMRLLPAIEDAEWLLLIDAIDLARPPGSAIELTGREIPRTLSVKLSPHQIDLSEVLALTELRGTLPRHMVAIGVQPETIAFGAAMSPRVEATLESLVETVVARLEQWGHHCERRTLVAEHGTCTS
jgi:hydrogenase maturation protease